MCIYPTHTEINILLECITLGWSFSLYHRKHNNKDLFSMHLYTAPLSFPISEPPYNAWNDISRNRVCEFGCGFYCANATTMGGMWVEDKSGCRNNKHSHTQFDEHSSLRALKFTYTYKHNPFTCHLNGGKKTPQIDVVVDVVVRAEWIWIMMVVSANRLCAPNSNVCMRFRYVRDAMRSGSIWWTWYEYKCANLLSLLHPLAMYLRFHSLAWVFVRLKTSSL